MPDLTGPRNLGNPKTVDGQIMKSFPMIEDLLGNQAVMDGVDGIIEGTVGDD